MNSSMTPEAYFERHLPYRLNLLTTFRERYSGRTPALRIPPFNPRDLHCCAKEIAFMMVRFFCGELGFTLMRGEADPQDRRGSLLYSNQRVQVSSLRGDPRYPDLVAVLKAANRATAHLEPDDVDHPFQQPADNEKIFSVIDWIEDLVRTNIYRASGRDLDAIMELPANKMR